MRNTDESLTINLDIEEAIQHGELTVHFQPIFDVKTLNPILVEAEALARWHHPKMGLLTPTEFEIWKHSDQITTKLSDYVLQRVVEQQATWKQQNIALAVAVNLSVAMISDNGFPKRLAVLLDQYNVDKASLILELTQHRSEILSTSVMKIVNCLRQDGFPIVLDDFSGNPVSFSKLPPLRLASIKLDAELISDLVDKEGVRLLVGRIIELAHDLNLPVCAKGVETLQHLSILQSLGCDKAQGWYLGKPMPSHKLMRLLVDRSGAPD